MCYEYMTIYKFLLLLMELSAKIKTIIDDNSK